MTDPLAWVDTHAHLADPRLRERLPAVLAAASGVGVTRIVAVGTTAADSPTVVELAEAHPGVFATVGIHPNDAADAAPDDWAAVTRLARTSKQVVALGETGLDRHWDRTPFPLQQDYFARHLDLAAELDLPVVIHARESLPDVIEQLTRLNRQVRGVLHSFVGSWADAETLLSLGLHISFAGMVTFANRSLDELRDVAAKVPLDRILVETDAPYLSPEPFRGRPNEPARTTITGERIAGVRGISLADLARATTANAVALFRLADATIVAPG